MNPTGRSSSDETGLEYLLAGPVPYCTERRVADKIGGRVGH
jgi:hypothetical protein